MGKARLKRLLGSALARSGAEFAEDRGYVVLDRPSRNEQAGPDLLVGLALAKQWEDLLLACGQPSRMGLGWGTRTGGNGADTKIAHGSAHQPRRRVGAKINKPCQRLSKMGLLFGVQKRQRGFIAIAQPIPQFGGMFTIPSDL